MGGYEENQGMGQSPGIGLAMVRKPLGKGEFYFDSLSRRAQDKAVQEHFRDVSGEFPERWAGDLEDHRDSVEYELTMAGYVFCERGTLVS